MRATIGRVIRVAGVNVPRAALTSLAIEMRGTDGRNLAGRIGQAIDGNAEELQLQPGDAEILARYLGDPPEALLELRDALLRGRG